MEPNTIIPRNMQRNWGWLLALGILFLILGLIGLGMLVSVTIVSMFVIGVLLLAGGIFQLIDSFQSPRWKGVLWHIVVGLLYLIAGGLLIYDPILSSMVITAALAWMLVFIGISRTIMAFSLKATDGWIWVLISGLITLILGILILIQWPMSGMWVIGLFISIELIIAGWAYLFMALALRKI